MMPSLLINADPLRDIDVIRVKGPTLNLNPIKLRKAGDLVIGEKTYSIGNPVWERVHVLLKLKGPLFVVKRVRCRRGSGGGMVRLAQYSHCLSVMQRMLLDCCINHCLSMSFGIVGFQEFEVSEAQVVKECIERENDSRSTCSTGTNEESSRSHAILQLAIKKHRKVRNLEAIMLEFYSLHPKKSFLFHFLRIP
ncbi:unnamed protein product [Cuscuta campestris]|uniref:Kinesin motor domain-containing protein n=1 Tax=Cuscuta campestris TaxID=132261 RepID=A0A484LC99_9ASTE|nr:unnamed protein product [Cuscuta campestris]